MNELPRHGPRTVLRRLTEADLPAFQEYRHDPEVGQFQGWRPQSDAEARAFLIAMQEKPLLQRGVWMQLGIARQAGNVLIGDVGLCVSAEATHTEVGFTLAREAQGQGLGREALSLVIDLVFEATPVARLEALTDERNVKAIRLLEKLGFHHRASRWADFRGQTFAERFYDLWRPVSGGKQPLPARP